MTRRKRMPPPSAPAPLFADAEQGAPAVQALPVEAVTVAPAAAVVVQASPPATTAATAAELPSAAPGPKIAPRQPTHKTSLEFPLDMWTAIDDEAMRRRRIRGGPLRHSEVVQDAVDLWLTARKQAPPRG